MSFLFKLIGKSPYVNKKGDQTWRTFGFKTRSAGRGSPTRIGHDGTCDYRTVFAINNGNNGASFLNEEQGVKIWSIFGLIHRWNGPAYISPAGDAWMKFGVLHRSDGPAITKVDGTKIWFLLGVHVSKEEVEQRIINKHGSSSSEHAYFVLKYN